MRRWFLRSLLCLSVNAAQRASACPDPPHFEVLAFHPLSVGNPDVPAPSALEVSISDAAKITGLLRQAEHAHTALPEGHKRVWVTELDWESAPQSPQGVPPSLQAAWVSRALHRLWVAGVSLVSWEYLLDAYPGVQLDTATGGIVEVPRPAAGLCPRRSRRPARERNPQAVPARLRVSVRSPARRCHPRAHLGAGDAVTPTRARAARAARRNVEDHRVVRADGSGVLNALVPLRGSMRLRARLPNAALTSAVSSLPARRSRL